MEYVSKIHKLFTQIPQILTISFSWLMHNTVICLVVHLGSRNSYSQSRHSRAMWIDICLYEFTHVAIDCQVGSWSCSTGLYFYIYCTNWWLYLVSWFFDSAYLPMSWLWSWPFQVQRPHVGGRFVYIEGD